MDKISVEKKNNLNTILKELIKTIAIMKEGITDYVLNQNEYEAKEWLKYLNEHDGKEELKSLENEISDRLFYRFDVQIDDSELDSKRVECMKKYIALSNCYCK